MRVLPSGCQAGNPELTVLLVTWRLSEPSAFTMKTLAGPKPRPPKKVPTPKATHSQSGDQVGISEAPSWRWNTFTRFEPSMFITLTDAVGLPNGKSRSVSARRLFFGHTAGNTSV